MYRQASSGLIPNTKKNSLREFGNCLQATVREDEVTCGRCVSACFSRNLDILCVPTLFRNIYFLNVAVNVHEKCYTTCSKEIPQ